MNKEHDFRPPIMTPDEFAVKLEEIITLVAKDKNFEQLAWTCRYQLNGLPIIFDAVLRGLEKKNETR